MRRRPLPAVYRAGVQHELFSLLKDCMLLSDQLSTLHITGMPLSEHYAHLLAQGLGSELRPALRSVQLARCDLADVELGILCTAFRVCQVRT